MRVVLRADVDGLGNKGDLVDVADGYARNYLVPKGFALRATAGVEAQAEGMRRTREVRDRAEREAAQDIATRLVSTPITVAARAGAEGKLFGSVTAADIVAATAEQTGFEIDRRAVGLAEPIRSIGTHQAQVRLHPEVEFPLAVEVVEES